MEKIKTFWTRQALEDVDAAISYVSQGQSQFAYFLSKRIQETVVILEHHPFIGRPGRIANTRELVVNETPYIIPYEVKSEGIIILAVLHTARKWPEPLDSKT